MAQVPDHGPAACAHFAFDAVDVGNGAGAEIYRALDQHGRTIRRAAVLKLAQALYHVDVGRKLVAEISSRADGSARFRAAAIL